MKTIRKHEFGEVTAYRLGYAPVGKPLMSVCVFAMGDLFIDTGQSHMQKTVLDIAAAHRVSTVLLTHHHEDHSGNAAAIKKQCNASVMAHPLTVDKLRQPFKIFPYQQWVWGPTTPLAPEPFRSNFFEHHGLGFQIIHSPGHSRDHCAFLVPDRGWLFSGDLYLGDHIKFFRADEKIDEQIHSLQHLLRYDFDALFCNHRPMAKNGKKHLASKLQFLEDFYGRVSSLARQGLDERTIMRQLGLKEQWLVKMICFGNVSMRNMVRSVMASSVAN